jgi:hypothetical protein
VVVIRRMRRSMRGAGVLACYLVGCFSLSAQGPAQSPVAPRTYPVSALPNDGNAPMSAEYMAVQHRLAQGWNTWDVNSVTTQVLLPRGLAIHLAMKHNTTENSEIHRPAR